MILTIFSDASYCPFAKVGGWASWIKRSDWPLAFQPSGTLFKTQLNNPHEAELCGLVNAIAHCLEIDAFLHVTRVYAQCDSTHTLGVFASITRAYLDKPRGIGDVPIMRLPPKTAVEHKATRWLRPKLKTLPPFTVRHIKGHTNNGGGRSWVNAYCDKEAKRQMNLARLAVKNQVESA